MTMIMSGILFLNLALYQIQGQLIIRPSESVLTRDYSKSFIALCLGQLNSRVIGWRSPQQRDVSDNENDRITVESQVNGVRLRIRNLTTEDQGAWECFGTDEHGRRIKKSFQMMIKVPITFHGDAVQYVALGEAAVIKCRVQASPVAEVSWFKGEDKTRIENPNYQLVHDGLHINQISMADNDTFSCRADVLETGESRDFLITVIVSKSISQTRITCANPCAIEKKTATLTCDASGLPAPKYLWFHGSGGELRAVKINVLTTADDETKSIPLNLTSLLNQFMSEIFRQSIEQFDSPVGASEVPKFVVRGNQLTINYVDEADNGKYSCQAFNEFDRKGQRAEYQLNVIVPPRLSPIPPVEINLDAQHPQHVSFQCRVERGSSDGLSLEWRYLNNTPIQSTNGIFIDQTQYVTQKSIELRFDPVRRQNFGNYSCVAKNLADSTYSIASLLIQFLPIYIGPNINVISSIPNYRTIMRCQFESYPSPQIQWIKLSRTIEDPEGRILAVDIDNGVNDITIKQTGSITYESVLSYTPTERDFGLSFECRALNPRIGRHTFTLQRAQPPKKVNVTDVKPLSNGAEIFIQSSETGDLPLLQYIVKYDLEDTEESRLQTVIVPAEATTEQLIKLENLRPSTNYHLIIIGESRAGVGQQTGPIQFRTLDKQIPDFLLEDHQNKTCLNDDSCLIMWNIRSDGGAPILRAEILYAQAKDEDGLDIEGPLSMPVSLDSSASEYELTGLKPDANYIVVVKLYNEAGVAEQKMRIRTNTNNNTVRKNLLVTDYRRNQPSKWAIIGIVVAIMFAAIAIVSGCVLLRVCRLDRKHTSTNSDHQTTPMMNGEHQSDKSSGRSSSAKLGDTV